MERILLLYYKGLSTLLFKFWSQSNTIQIYFNNLVPIGKRRHQDSIKFSSDRMTPGKR